MQVKERAVARELFLDMGLGQKRERQKERVFVKFGPRFFVSVNSVLQKNAFFCPSKQWSPK